MKQYTENQYDDDLTIGTDDYDDSYYTGSVDFFEFATDEESPISRLKSLILSIDWEITDEILMQFNEELVDLRDIWAGEKINLVYVQALEKISKYIYQKKADSHPSAIKLLLTLYHNLEKIVSSFDLTEAQKKEILLEDVKRFESLKRHIGQPSQAVEETQTAQPKVQKQTENLNTEKDLLNLKAIVLGIDWEITDQDLNELRQEVVRLEGKFVDSRPKLILLQGIGTLGAYIKLKKSNAHADAFRLLHLFYESLEKIVTTPMQLEEEKAILFPAVEKFNSFKTLLGSTIAPESISRDEKDADEDESPVDSATPAPAFADLPEQELMGFQAEEEAQALGLDSSGNIDSHIESFFTGSAFQNLDADIRTDGIDTASGDLHEIALQGVNVEVDDEEDAPGMLSGSEDIAPALSEVNKESGEIEPSPAFLGEELLPAEDQVVFEDSLGFPAAKVAETSVDLNFADKGEEKAARDFSQLDRDLVLQGVDVETDADDDSDEEALPLMGGELAPALAENDEVSIYNAEIFENPSNAETVDAEIAGTLGGFFDEEIESHLFAAPTVEDDTLDVAPVAFDSTNGEREIDSSADSSLNLDLEQTAVDDQNGETQVEEEGFAPLATEGVVASGEEAVILVGDDSDNITPVMELEDEAETVAFVSELDPEEKLDSFFGDSEFEQSSEEDVFVQNLDIASFEEEQKEHITELDEQLDSFFDLEENVEELQENTVHFALPKDTAEEIVTVEEKTVPPVLGDIEEEVVFELVSETDKVTEAYQPLRTCVESLGLELDDKVIMGLWEEINHLYQKLADKPLEKTFLALLSTITRHVDLNRYDSSADAYVLLQSVCSALTELQEDNLQQNQEMLLSETHKVLKWQEQLLAQQVARNEAELTIGSPILNDQEDVYGDSDVLVQNYDEEPAVERFDDNLSSTVGDHNAVIDDTDGKIFDHGEFKESTLVDEAHERLAEGVDAKKNTNDFKQEISTLRQTLQDEIAELRKELKGNYH